MINNYHGGEKIMEVKKVCVRKDGVKYIIIPKHSNIIGGDLVTINKLEEKNGRRTKNK